MDWRGSAACSYGTGRCFDRTGVIRLCSKQCGTSLRQAGYEKCNCIFSDTWCCDIWKYFIPWLFICNPNPDRSYCRICGSVLSWNLRFLTGSSSFLVRPAKLPTCKVWYGSNSYDPSGITCYYLRAYRTSGCDRQDYRTGFVKGSGASQISVWR